MKRFLLLSLWVIFTATVAMSFDRARVSSLKSRIDALYAPVYPNPLEPGAIVAVVKDGRIALVNAYGVADTGSLTPVTASTQFCIASVSKQFAAIAILQLCSEGKISLNDPLSRFFPEFPSVFGHVTLHHILSHTSGIPDARPRNDLYFVRFATDSASVQYMRTLTRLSFPPGSRYEYINPTYQLIYQIVERVTGTPFETYMRQHVFAPAGMTATAYFEPDRSFSRLAHGYTPDPKGGYREFDYGEESFFATKADGALYTTINDFVCWENALAAGKILPLEWLGKAYTPHITIPVDANYGYQPHTGYGYGFFIQQRPDRPVTVYHTGDNGGFTIYAGKLPRHRLNLLFFSTRDNIDRMRLVNATLDILAEYNYLD